MSKFILPLCSLGLCLFAYGASWFTHLPPPSVEPPAAAPTSPYAQAVAGVGTVEPVSDASGNGATAIGVAQPGIVTKVHVQTNQTVTAGALLFELDPRPLQTELQVRLAALKAAQAQFDKLQRAPRPEELPALEAQVKKAEAHWMLKQDELKRARNATPKTGTTKSELVGLEQACEMARQDVLATNAQLKLLKAGTWKPDLDIASANVAMARAQVEQARTQLDVLKVRAPAAGTILQVNVRPGEQVGSQPGQPLVLMGNVKSLYVRVHVDEEDLPRLKSYAAAQARIRGDARRQDIPLHFVRIEPTIVPKVSLTGFNAERVDTRVGQVIYRIDDQARKQASMLMVGQVLDVFIDCQ